MTIKCAIIDFFTEMYTQGRKSFRLSDLTAYVRGVCAESYSPESAGRTLRKLRAQGIVDYGVIGNGEEYIVG